MNAMLACHCRTPPSFRAKTGGTLPDSLKDPKNGIPLIIPKFPQCSNGFILGGFYFLYPLGGLCFKSLSPSSISVNPSVVPSSKLPST